MGADFLTALGTILGSVGATITAGYYLLRKLRRDISTDGAERFANDWHQKVIARQDQESARLRNEIGRLSETMTQSTARILELERENAVKRKVISELVEDIRAVKRGSRGPETLDTGIADDL